MVTAKAPRAKAPALPLITSLEQCDLTLAEIKSIDRQINTIKTEMQEKVDAITTKAAQETAPLLERKKHLEKDLAEYGTKNRESIFIGKSKTRKLSHGELNFRICPPSCEIIKGKWTVAACLSAIEARLPKPLQDLFIRRKPELNKEEILNYDSLLLNPPADGEKPQPVEWEAIGLRIVRDKEEFGYNLYEAELPADYSESKDAA